jgi:regulator of sigma E protease
VNTFVGVIVGVVGLGFLILVHEFGHYIVAKATGMRVEEFSLGFGPFLISRRWGETVYGISWIPLGGYVRVTGMHKEEFEQRVAELREQEAEEAAKRTESIAAVESSAVGGSAQSASAVGRLGSGKSAKGARRRPEDPEDRLAGKRALSAEEIASTPPEHRYYTHPLWHKVLFIIAGVAMNMIVAYGILYVVGIAEGENWGTAVVGTVDPGSGADDAGIEPGDRIVSLAGLEIADWDGLKWEILKHKGETVAVTVERDGETLPLQAEIREGDTGLGQLGIGWGGEVEHRDVGLAGGFAYAGRETADTVVYIFEGIGMMFSRDVPVTGSQGLSGPVGIVQISADVVRGGFASYLWFLALISINLALLNMLPLLPLDGGHVVLSIIERIRGRSISLRVFERVSMVGLALFALLFLVAMYNDVGRIFTGY